jgi:site-specific recombinase XerD
MPILGWRVHFTRRQLTMPRTSRPMLQSLPAYEAAAWLDREGIDDGVPFLLSPEGHYDTDLNAYFLLNPAPGNTQAAIAYDLAAFLTFLWRNRRPVGERSWRDATAEDRAAYQRWRRVDERGPGVKGSTWAREVATVNAFYRWAVEAGFVAQNPILQREMRGRRGQPRADAAPTPAEAPKDGHREELAWLPPMSYRRWRDIGVRGYLPSGLPDPSFRGRNGARNTTFCDLMVRTGLRLAEQASLTLFDVPEVDAGRAYAPTRIPSAIAKNGSGRRIYIPAAVLRDLWDYIRFDRAELIEQARRHGTYERLAGTLLVEDPQLASIAPGSQAGSRRRPVATLSPRHRRRLFICGTDGLEPAALWLNKLGLPVMPGTWQSMFSAANDRCQRHDIGLRAHPHLLRHTYAVVTLEQLQREHIRELGAMNPAQRTTYEQVFGDPLDWVRRPLGHRSVETTFKYLHTLNELEMETRLALVPDEWDTGRMPTDELHRETADDEIAMNQAAPA